ncbi:MAG: PAS domain-containing protein, partial [Candidatus Cloacimonetes bacterium]|nr:PAS domain-containing protein [Candidatus Cloacimonadota bacterium]
MTRGSVKKSILTKFVPLKILAVSFTFTIILFIALGWFAWDSYDELKSSQSRVFRIKQLKGIIIYYDEVLTMSAYMAVATGELKWEERYRDFEPQLDAIIKETMQIVPDSFISEAAARTDVANIRLVAMENHAFDLVRQDNRKAAMNILLSEEYKIQKINYSEGMQQITQYLEGKIKIMLKKERRQMFFVISAVLIALPILLFIWVYTFYIFKKYMKERKLAEEERVKAVSAVVNAMGDALLLHTLDGKIMFVNPAFEKMTGYESSELVGEGVTDLLSKIIKPEDVEKIIASVETVLKGKIFTPVSIRFVSKENRETPVAITVSFIEDQKGEPSSVVIV